MRKIIIVAAILVLIVVGAAWLVFGRNPKTGHVLDEALAAGRDPGTFTAADEDYFHAMDGGIALTPDEVKGRNTWNVWTGGNDAMWDKLTVTSVGALDFLKIVTSGPGLKFSRDNRWEYLGLVNNPCFVKATEPDAKHFGLWLDQRRPDCPPDPFENEQKYPGVKIGARGKNLPGRLLLRLRDRHRGTAPVPQSGFRRGRRREVGPGPLLQRPELLRVQRSDPTVPHRHVVRLLPRRPESGESAGRSRIIRSGRIFLPTSARNISGPTASSSGTPTTRASRFRSSILTGPGTLDTSLISSDNINNPRTMNAVYMLGPRLEQASRWGKETLAGGGLNNKQFNDYVQSGPLTAFFETPEHGVDSRAC